MRLLAVGLGGFLGSLGRYLITRLLERFAFALPLGTLLSNVAAALLIGLIIGFERQMPALTPAKKLFLTTGLLGGLSTFSTFSLETVALLEAGKVLHALGNVGLNVGLSLVFVFAGFALSKLFAAA